MKIVKIPSVGYGSNCWLLIDEESGAYAMIDPSPEIDAIRSALERRGLQPGNLRYILLTHGHFDHILSVDALRDLTGAPVFIHRADADFLTNSEHNGYKFFFRREFTMRPAERLLEDGDVLPLGNTEIRVLHTPGHTGGCVCYIAGDAMFTGDTLFDQDIGRTDLYSGDPDALQRSLQRLAALPGDYTLYPGHGSVTTLEKQRNYNYYLKSL